MNEADTRAELIEPALKEAGWGVVEARRIRREVIAPGRIEGGGNGGNSGNANLLIGAVGKSANREIGVPMHEAFAGVL